MGNLLNRPDERLAQQEQERIQQERILQKNEQDRLQRLQHQQEILRQQQYKILQEQELENIRSLRSGRVLRSNIVHDIIVKRPETSEWNHQLNNNHTMVQVSVVENTPEFNEVKRKFKHTNKRFFEVTGIKRIQNPYLMLSYLLKKEEKQRRFSPKRVRVMSYFHGATSDKIALICKQNFNYRLCGKNKGHKFGQGVSFATFPYYATHYSAKQGEKMVLLVYVLEVEAHLGNQFTRVPNDGFDTTQKDDNSVHVKYEDNEFYPAYVISYYNKETDRPPVNYNRLPLYNGDEDYYD